MSDKLKEEIAKELGVYETVKRDGGWQNVSSKDCGNIVTKAIEIANRNVQQANKKVVSFMLTAFIFKSIVIYIFLAYNIRDEKRFKMKDILVIIQTENGTLTQ